MANLRLALKLSMQEASGTPSADAGKKPKKKKDGE